MLIRSFGINSEATDEHRDLILNTRNMTTVQLSYIIAVDTHKSFARAAEACFVTQPTLSMQIRKLEEEMGVILFDRSKKPVMTTQMGNKIIEQAKVVLKEMEQINVLIDSQKEEVSGELRLGIIPTISPYLLPLFLANFSEAYPKVQLVIEELLSDEILQKLDQDLLDIGILVAPESIKPHRKRTLYYEEFYLYFSSQHPLTTQDEIALDELNLEEMWLLKEGHCFRDQIVNLCGGEATPTHLPIKFETGSLETVKRMVEHNFGFTLIPHLATQDILPENLKYLRRFKHQKPLREVSLVSARNFLKARLIDALEQIIKQRLDPLLLTPEAGTVVSWR